MPIIDSQVHVYEANTPARPWATTPNWPPHVNGDEMVAAMDAVGVDGGIFVSSFSMYQFDASYAIEVQRAHPGKFGLVKPINPDAPDIPDIIADWKATAGTVGVRIMLTHEPQRDPSHPGLAIIAREAARHNFPINLLTWDRIEAGTTLIDANPNTRFVLDHLGILQPREPVAPGTAWEPWADLPAVLELAKRDNVVIKVSGACTLSKVGYPYGDIWEPLARVFDAWGMDRCLWGTDWTRANAVLSYEQGVKPFVETDRLSDSDRAMLMGGACTKVYNWSPSS